VAGTRVNIYIIIKEREIGFQMKFALRFLSWEGKHSKGPTLFFSNSNSNFFLYLSFVLTLDVITC